MKRSTITSNAATVVVLKSEENQRIYKSNANTTVSKFFDRQSDIQSHRPLNMSNKNKRGNTIAKLYRERMVCSEDVSRKKRAKIDVATKSTTNSPTKLDNSENDGDFLENLKKNFEKNSLKQSLLENQLYRRKLPLKPRALFNEESLKLINNFKDYIKEKDEITTENVNVKIPIQNNTIPFKDTSNDQYQQIMGNNNEIRQNNISNTRPQLNFLERNPINTKAMPGISKELSNYSNQLINCQGESSQLFEPRYDTVGIRSISQMQTPDPLSYVTTVMDQTDDNDLTVRYPTPPLIYD